MSCDFVSFTINCWKFAGVRLTNAGALVLWIKGARCFACAIL